MLVRLATSSPVHCCRKIWTWRTAVGSPGEFPYWSEGRGHFCTCGGPDAPLDLAACCICMLQFLQECKGDKLCMFKMTRYKVRFAASVWTLPAPQVCLCQSCWEALAERFLRMSEPCAQVLSRIVQQSCVTYLSAPSKRAVGAMAEHRKHFWPCFSLHTGNGNGLGAGPQCLPLVTALATSASEVGHWVRYL